MDTPTAPPDSTSATPPEGRRRPEPLLSTASTGVVLTAAAAALTLAAAYGLPITPEQRAAVLGFISAAGPVAVALYTWLVGRRRVTPLADPRDVHGRPLVALTASEAAGVDRMRRDNTTARLRAVARLVAGTPDAPPAAPVVTVNGPAAYPAAARAAAPLARLQSDEIHARINAELDRSLVVEHNTSGHAHRPGLSAFREDCPACRATDPARRATDHRDRS